MENLIRKLETYLKETLGITVESKKWEEDNVIPFYLRDRYEFLRIEMLKRQVILMAARNPEEETPVTVKKHRLAVTDITDGEVVYVNNKVTSYNRRRLIEHKIPFIIPGNQMYLPMFAIDLREHFRNNRVTKHKLSPSTQTVVLHALITRDKGPYTPTGLAEVLDYTVMTLTRAFDELESFGIGTVKIEGRERRLMLDMEPQELWKKVKGYLRNPIKKRTWIEPQHLSVQGVKGGLSALSDNTMLAEPQQVTFAYGVEEWKVVKLQDKINEVPANDPEAYQIEIWFYSPRLFARDNIVDRFSLYASLMDENDERIQSMLDELLEDGKW